MSTQEPLLSMKDKLRMTDEELETHNWLITTELTSIEQYESALAAFDKVFDAKVNTPEGDFAFHLADLIEAYENKHFQI